LNDRSAAVINPWFPDSIVRELTGRRFALIGFAAMEAERLCGALEGVGANSKLFGTEDSVECAAIDDYSGIIMANGCTR
jgi:hypothetical protein